MTDPESPDHDWSRVPIVWEGRRPPVGVTARVRQDIRTWLGDLPRPQVLTMHLVSLTENPEGPSVMLWGEPGPEVFHARYSKVTAFDSVDVDNPALPAGWVNESTGKRRIKIPKHPRGRR